MGELCRLEVRSSNQKSLLVLGLIANILAQRTDGYNEGGGESGIRTHGTVSRTHAFQGCALSHSAISPDATLLKGDDDSGKRVRPLSHKFPQITEQPDNLAF